MASKLFFSVCEHYDGTVTVSSFGGSNLAEEKRFAVSGDTKTLHMTTTDHDAAQRHAGKVRARIAARKPQVAPPAGTTMPQVRYTAAGKPDASEQQYKDRD